MIWPPSIRSRFTELFVEAPDKTQTDLIAVAEVYLGGHCQSDLRIAADIAQLYLDIKKPDRVQCLDGWLRSETSFQSADFVKNASVHHRYLCNVWPTTCSIRGLFDELLDYVER